MVLIRMLALRVLRYTPNDDTLRLVSQRYYTRDDNRRDLLRIIYGAHSLLVLAGT
jgi:hypothetical protein